MLDVSHVRKEFGKVRAVKDVSFHVDDGVTFGLIGPNGAGKTTIMRMILGILVPDGGSLTWNGKPVDSSMRRRCGYLPEERGLYGKMRVRDQIAFFGRLHGLVEPEIGKRTDAWIERLGIEQYADRPCSELSKGNQQKVQVASAAVHDPELLILDEPFTGLDPVNAEMLLGVLSELKAKGTSLILSSHQMWQMEELCSRFCIINGGENRVSGSLAELRASWPTRVLRVAPATPAVRAIVDRVPGATFVADNDGKLDYAVPSSTDFAAVLRAIVGTEAITSFEAIEPSLHDIYIHEAGRAVA
ncbi:MAG TPA: ATP-binding cassette domain-containing protein [Candidatus Baltobacteraceae bacterium]